MDQPSADRADPLPLVLYVIACGAHPAGQLPDFVTFAQGQGWDVCVILTPEATKFADSRLLARLTRHPVRAGYKHPGEPDVLPKPDAVVVAPATFNTVNKITAGINDTLAAGLVNEAISARLPVAAAPWASVLAGHPAFSRSIAMLRGWGVTVIAPAGQAGPAGTAAAGDRDVFPWAELRASLAGLRAATQRRLTCPAPGDLAAMTPAWADEFDGPAGSPPDPAIWTAETGGGGWGNEELQYYTGSTENAALDGAGNLVITVRLTDLADRGRRYGGCRYTSARLITADAMTARYGLIQARMKLPGGTGIWPAFWMLGEDFGTAGWPQCGEIDVMENFGTDPASVSGTVHGPGYCGADGVTASHQAGASLAEAFHTYSVAWEPARISWFLDDHQYAEVTPADLSGHQWLFDHNFFLLLNVAVGGTAPVPPENSSIFPQQLLVDYVRVYTLQP